MQRKKVKKTNSNGRSYANKGGRGKTEDRQFNDRNVRRDEISDDVNHRYNDVSWYAKNDAMLRDAASYSYNSPLGKAIPWDSIYNVNSGNLDGYPPDSIPGIDVLSFVPTIGVSVSSASPANLAAQNIYTYVRYMNSGSKNYDQADLMIYLLAMDSIYMVWNWLKRFYGYARIYSQKNMYMPRGFAMGDCVNLEDAAANLADFRMQLNALAARISSFCVPAVMPLFIRHSWMVSNLYKDADNDKAQIYMFTPAIFYQYDETGSQYGGKLVAKPLLKAITSLLTYSQIVTQLNAAIDAIAYSEDIGVMSGDILKAYGQDKLFKISPVEPDYEVIPVYNEEVLNQIHNSTLVNTSTSPGVLDITQDPNTGYLIWNPTFNQESLIQLQAFVNMPWNDVAPANTMVATRLTALRKSVGNGKNQFLAVGSEFIKGRYMLWLADDGSYTRREYGNTIILNDTVGDDNNFAASIIAGVSNFDWHPLMPILIDEGEKGFRLCGIVGDVTNYTVISGYSMEQLHTTALLSEFNVPQIGSF